MELTALFDSEKSIPVSKLSGISAQASRLSKNERSWWLLLTVLGFFSALSFVAVLFWEGPSADRGPIWRKLAWSFNMSQADEAIRKSQFERAQSLLESAESNAKKLGDSDLRLEATWKKIADLYWRPSS